MSKNEEWSSWNLKLHAMFSYLVETVWLDGLSSIDGDIYESKRTKMKLKANKWSMKWKKWTTNLQWRSIVPWKRNFFFGDGEKNFFLENKYKWFSRMAVLTTDWICSILAKLSPSFFLSLRTRASFSFRFFPLKINKHKRIKEKHFFIRRSTCEFVKLSRQRKSYQPFRNVKMIHNINLCLIVNQTRSSSTENGAG